MRDLLEHASTSFDEGSFKEACDYYRAALKLSPSRETSCNLGLAARLSGNVTEAMQALMDCLAEPLPPLDPNDDDEKARRVRFRGDLEVVRQQTGAIQVTTSAGAEVVIDDLPRGVAPLSAIFVLPGTHSVAVRDGRGTARESVAVGAGMRVSIALEPKASTIPPEAKTAAPIAVLPPPAKGGETQSLVGLGWLAAGLAFGTGFVTLTTAKIISAQVEGDNEQFKSGTPEFCAASYQKEACEDVLALRRTSATLQTMSLVSFAVSAVVGGATFTYASTSQPARGPLVSVNPSGFSLGWRGAW
jgi:hypothetical protein